jgi:hypothetical protein
MYKATRGRIAAAAVSLGVLGVVASSSGTAFAARPLPSGPPTVTPASGTPALLKITKNPQQIRQLVQCGTRMYAVGSFRRLTQRGHTIRRENAFSFKAKAPYTVTKWHPRVNGEVNSIAFRGNHCGRAYLGGEFTKVGKRKKTNLAEVTTRKGSVVRRFKAKPDLSVETLMVWHNHLLTGGFFTTMSGSAKHAFFASLRLTNGKDDGYLSLHISGHYHYKNPKGIPTSDNPTRVYNLQLSHGGTRLLVEGDFKRMAGKSRQQVAMLNLHRKHATLNHWHPTEFNHKCAVNQPFYAKAGAWSANDKQIFIATTGFAPNSGPGATTSGRRAGLCDAAAAFPAKARKVKHQWVNYAGCDSLFSVAADKHDVYIGGHERWVNNRLACNTMSPKAKDAQGMAGLSPRNGALVYNPTRARGIGADDMLITRAGLWVASDNFDGADECGGVSGHAGICLLPYS